MASCLSRRKNIRHVLKSLEKNPPVTDLIPAKVFAAHNNTIIINFHKLNPLMHKVAKMVTYCRIMGFGAILAWFLILTSGRSGAILATLCIKGLKRRKIIDKLRCKSNDNGETMTMKLNVGLLNKT